MAASPDEILAMVFFARVVEAKSFTAAAAKLRVSKSVVSARVAALEAALKVRLLQRTTRKLSLTAEGLALYERCARIVTAADEASQTAAATGDAPRGLLRINAPTVFAQHYLAAPMAAYLARHPDVRIELTMNDRLIDLVEEGVDVAIRIVTALKPRGLVARRLANDHTVLCASPAYLSRRGTPQSPEDLLQHDCLIYSLLRVADEWLFHAPGSKSAPFSLPLEGRFSVASGAMLREATLAGMGLAVLPNFMVAHDLAAGRLRPVVDAFAGVALGIYAVYPEGPRPASKTRTFVDALASHFKTPPWPPTAGPAKKPRSP